MTEAAHYITIDKDSDLGRQLAEARADGAPIVLAVDGCSYRITPLVPAPSDDPFQNYDPERALIALAESAGALRRIDRDQLLRDIYAARGQDSHGRPA